MATTMAIDVPTVVEEDTMKTYVERSDMSEEDLKRMLWIVEEVVKVGGGDESHVSDRIKERMDRLMPPPGWNCVCGRDFGAYVQHQGATFAFVYCGKMAILVFRSAGDKRRIPPHAPTFTAKMH